MAMNVPPPLTATGTELPALDPSPRGPAPQQYAAPAVVRPHVRDAPALNAENVTPPVTATGTALPALDPSPSSPRAPQQYAAPLAVRPQACSAPELTDAKANPAGCVARPPSPPHPMMPATSAGNV